MHEKDSHENSFPLADAVLAIPPERIERMRSKLERHGAIVDSQSNDKYHVLFPEGTQRMELFLRYPRQHRILFPDGYSFLVLDPPQEEEQQQGGQTMKKERGYEYFVTL